MLITSLIMESKSYLFPIPEIEVIILSFLDPAKDYQKIIQLNKYFFDIISNDETYKDLKLFFQKTNRLDIYVTGYDLLNLTFLKACACGHLQVAKYFYHNFNKKIDIHAGEEFAFRLSCSNDYVDMAKFLFSLDGKIDIHAKNDHAIRDACFYGYVDIVEFIYSLDKEGCLDFYRKNSAIHHMVYIWFESLSESK